MNKSLNEDTPNIKTPTEKKINEPEIKKAKTEY